jgi:glycosyltransferase involved in cell wall biosynthesis
VRERPEVLVFQWWSGTVFHSYLLLALAGRLLGSRIVIEFHEVLDTGEANMPVARAYVGVIAPLILRLASAFAVHNSADRALLEQHYDLAGRPVAVLPIGAFDHYRGAEDTEPVRPCPPEVCNLLYFGVIRWYKGLEDLIEAFDSLEPDEVDRYWLTVVGETWEGYEAPAKLIERSRYRDRITFVNRYVSDEEVSGFFAGADAVVLPYRRASTSGPLHIAMGYGLPVLLADVESLNESAEGYGGVVSVPPANPAELTKGIRRVAALEGEEFEHPNSWEGTAESYAELFAAALGRPAPPARAMVA